jgi:hypothetical protein
MTDRRSDLKSVWRNEISDAKCVKWGAGLEAFYVRHSIGHLGLVRSIDFVEVQFRVISEGDFFPGVVKGRLVMWPLFQERMPSIRKFWWSLIICRGLTVWNYFTCIFVEISGTVGLITRWNPRICRRLRQTATHIQERFVCCVVCGVDIVWYGSIFGQNKCHNKIAMNFFTMNKT